MIDELSPDQFHVVVENDIDRELLMCFINRIGEAKLRKSVANLLLQFAHALTSRASDITVFIDGIMQSAGQLYPNFFNNPNMLIPLITSLCTSL